MIALNAGSLVFWSSISQIVPVLALAFLLESRQLIRRWAKKRNTPTMRVRGYGSTFLVVISVALTFVEMIALGDLAVGQFYLWETSVAISVIAITLFVVISMPVSQIANAMVLDSAPTKRSERKYRKKVHRIGIENRVKGAKITGSILDNSLDRSRVLSDLDRLRNGAIPLEGRSEQELEKILGDVSDKSITLLKLKNKTSQTGQKVTEEETGFLNGYSPQKRKERAKQMRKLMRELAG